MTVGTVAVLRRHPVKSMLGEQVAATEVTGRRRAARRSIATP
jgi:hypothetical protein